MVSLLELSMHKNLTRRWLSVAIAALPLPLYFLIFVNTIFALPATYRTLGYLDLSIVSYTFVAVFMLTLQVNLITETYRSDFPLRKLGMTVGRLHLRCFFTTAIVGLLSTLILNFLKGSIQRRYQQVGSIDFAVIGNALMALIVIVSSSVLLFTTWRAIRAFSATCMGVGETKFLRE